MKLLRHGAPGSEKPGLQLPDGSRIDASGFGQDWNEAFFADPTNLDRLRDWAASAGSSAPVLAAGTRLGSAIARPSKIICIGLNFSDHARETGATPPAEPIVFFKASSALVGPDDHLVIPRDSEKTDWEVELGVVIGRRASYVEEGDALSHVAGYVLHNDYSERHFQLERGGQWVKGKSCDTFAPVGPFLATPDEIADVNDLRMWLKVNGETMQDGNTCNLIFNIPTLISYLSRFMTLLPGDLISTGTPAGVGLGMKPPRFVKPGDVIELGIAGLGEQRQEAVAWSAR
jgi:2,4-diketo-3-deoxy-L-fuconate hydrolase